MHKLYITIAGNDAIFTVPFFQRRKRPFAAFLKVKLPLLSKFMKEFCGNAQFGKKITCNQLQQQNGLFSRKKEK